jgi:hypothetical protein
MALCRAILGCTHILIAGMNKQPKWTPLAAGTLLCAALVLLVLIGHRAQSDHGPQTDARSDMPMILRLLH